MDRYRVIQPSGAQAQRERDLAQMAAAEEERRKEGERRFAERDQEKRERAKRIAEIEAREAEEEAERAAKREALRRERTEAAERELKKRMRATYLETPGSTPGGFERIWPNLLEQHQIEQTLAAAPMHDRLVNEFKAMRRGGHDFFEKPLPVPIED